MTRKDTNTAARTLADLEATGDRLAEWSSQHAATILAVIAAVLVAAAGIGFYAQHRSAGRRAAANALALASSEYRQAMGADPLGGAIPEPANAEVAAETREQFSQRFVTVAGNHEERILIVPTQLPLTLLVMSWSQGLSNELVPPSSGVPSRVVEIGRAHV